MRGNVVEEDRDVVEEKESRKKIKKKRLLKKAGK